MSAVKDQKLNESIEQQAREAELEAENEKLRSRVQMLEDERLDALEALGVEIVDDDKAESQPSEPIKIETEGVFNQDYLEEPEAFIDNPMVAMMKPLITEYFQAMRPKPLEPIKTEHKVRIFRLPELMASAEIESVERAIEALLNDGYCCHMPTVCNDYVIMDFSRRKETEENETQTKTT